MPIYFSLGYIMMQLFIIAFILIYHTHLDSIGSSSSYPHLSKFNVFVASFHASIPYPLPTKKQQPFFYFIISLNVFKTLPNLWCSSSSFMSQHLIKVSIFCFETKLSGFEMTFQKSFISIASFMSLNLLNPKTLVC